MKSNITILGCGLSGMITALSFASKGIKTTIIEARSISDKSFFHDIRTTALTSSSKKMFDEIKIWDDINKISGPINDIYVADNKAPSMLHFTSSTLPYDEVMGYLVENNKFKQQLLSLCQNNPNIAIIDNTIYNSITNSEDGCSLILNNKHKHECDLLIVCDGRNSKAKLNFFSASTEKKYPQHALTFITKHEISHDGTAIEHFMPSGPFAILPLKNTYHSSIVWTVNEKASSALMQIPREEFGYLVQENFGNFLGKIEIQGDIGAFPLKAYLTRNYYNKRIVLVADSAHIIHPLAGQGLNQGIKDIETLVAMILQYGANEKALSSYQNIRKNDNNIMFEITDNINRIFSTNYQLFHFARQIGFRAIELFPPLKNVLVKYAKGKR